MMASLLIYEYKFKGVFLGLIWVIAISFSRLLLGVNTVNQIIFGISIGIWLSVNTFYVFDYKKSLTRHFQKIIRGRYLDENDISNAKIFSLTMSMVIIYLSFYIAVDIYFNSDPHQIDVLNDYFANIQRRCLAETNTNVQTKDKMLYFYQSANLQFGCLFSFGGVYMGARHRHKYHGMQRIDYTAYLEYDNSPCKYFFHVIFMFLVRVFIMACIFILPF